MSNLILIRGIPGAGKTTVANLFSDYVKISADDWFYRDGIYSFNREFLGEAHQSCYAKCASAMNYKYNVVVHNTFTTEKEIEPYKKLAEEHRYAFYSLIIENRHGNSSIHNVPPETIEKMKNRFSVRL